MTQERADRARSDNAIHHKPAELFPYAHPCFSLRPHEYASPPFRVPHPPHRVSRRRAATERPLHHGRRLSAGTRQLRLAGASRRISTVSPNAACSSTAPTASRRSAILRARRCSPACGPTRCGIWNNSIALPRTEPRRDDAPALVQGARLHHALRRQDLPQLAHQGARRSALLERAGFLHYANHGNDNAAGHRRTAAESRHELQLAQLQRRAICECRDVPDEAYYDGRVAAEAVRVLGEVKDSSPSSSPSASGSRTRRSMRRRNTGTSTIARSCPPLNPSRPARRAGARLSRQHAKSSARPHKQKPLTPEQIAEMRHGYFANISYLDAQLGKVLDALDKQRPGGPHHHHLRRRPRLSHRRAHAVGQDLELRLRRARAVLHRRPGSAQRMAGRPLRSPNCSISSPRSSTLRPAQARGLEGISLMPLSPSRRKPA